MYFAFDASFADPFDVAFGKRAQMICIYVQGKDMLLLIPNNKEAAECFGHS